MVLFKTLVLREEVQAFLGLSFYMPEGKAFAIPFGGCDPMKDSEEFEEIGL